MTLLVCSIFQLLSVYPHSTTSHHLGEQRLNTVLLLNIISPSLEYSPDNLDKDIKELSQYGSSKNTSHGRSEESFIINPVKESFYVQNEVNNSKDSIIVKLQNLHEIYHRIWRHDSMKRVTMKTSENQGKSLSTWEFKREQWETDNPEDEYYSRKDGQKETNKEI